MVDDSHGVKHGAKAGEADEHARTAPHQTPVLLGQNEAEAEFLGAWLAGRAAHAWMLCGPKGIGKATLAYRIARYVLVNGNPADKAAQATPGLFGVSLPEDVHAGANSLDVSWDNRVVHQITAQGHPDLKVLKRGINPNTNKQRDEIVVDDVRAAIHFMTMKAADGGWRVVIVDAVDEMNNNAANGLLKILEEPPAKALLLLVSHNPARLLPTIRSRCRKLQLSPLNEKDIQHILQSQIPDLSSDYLLFLSRLSEGSVGRAMQLADLGGPEIYQKLIKLLASLPGMDVKDAYAFCDDVLKREDGFRITGELLSWWLARTIAISGKGDDIASILPGVPGEIETAIRLINSAPLAQWVQVWEKINTTISRARAVHLDPRQTLISCISDIDALSQGKLN